MSVLTYPSLDNQYEGYNSFNGKDFFESLLRGKYQDTLITKTPHTYRHSRNYIVRILTGLSDLHTGPWPEWMPITCLSLTISRKALTWTFSARKLCTPRGRRFPQTSDSSGKHDMDVSLGDMDKCSTSSHHLYCRFFHVQATKGGERLDVWARITQYPWEVEAVYGLVCAADRTIIVPNLQMSGLGGHLAADKRCPSFIRLSDDARTAHQLRTPSTSSIRQSVLDQIQLYGEEQSIWRTASLTIVVDGDWSVHDYLVRTLTWPKATKAVNQNPRYFPPIHNIHHDQKKSHYRHMGVGGRVHCTLFMSRTVV